MVTIRNQLVSSRAVTSSGTNPRRYITIHETANTARGANAQAHANLQSNGFSASWHITVDDTQAIRSYPDTVRCWHAGDGSGHGNMSSIGIEICVNSDGNFNRAKANAAAVVRQLRQQYNIPRSRVVQHNHWSGKNCPANLRRSGWAAFLASTDPGSSSGGSVSRPAFVSPAEGRVSSEWGSRRHPITGKAGFHRGIDIANNTGTPIYAAYGGTVRQANTGTGNNPITGAWNTGRSIIIDGPGGGSEFYGHLNTISVRKGQRVQAGDQIGTMGATGNVTGPHLHFERWAGRSQGGGAGKGNTINPRVDFNRHGIRPGSKPVRTNRQHIPEKGQAVMATPQQIWAYSNPDVDERQVYRMLRNMAEDAWGHRDLDYLNNNATTKNHQLARSAQRSHQIWQRIRQVAWRTWLATGIWNRRIAPEATVATQFPNIRKDGYRASTWQQYTYLQVRRAREEADQRAQRAEAKADKLELMIETLAHAEGEHIYEAVAAAMAEHDRRQVEVSVQVSAPEEQAADEAEAETDQVLDGDDDPKEEES